MSSLLLQLHLTRENEPEVPLFVITRKLWDWAVAIFLRMRVADARAGARELQSIYEPTKRPRPRISTVFDGIELSSTE
ncbi:hypothetical protein ACP6JD_006272 [Aspergillus fumigatus]